MRFLCVNCNGVRSKKAEIENLIRYISADVVLLSLVKQKLMTRSIRRNSYPQAIKAFEKTEPLLVEV